MAESTSQTAEGGSAATEQELAKGVLAAAEWKLTGSNRGLIPVMSPLSSDAEVEKMASALTTLGIDHERLSGERQAEFNTPLRIRSGGRPGFFAVLKDSALDGKRSTTAEEVSKVAYAYIDRSKAPAR